MLTNATDKRMHSSMKSGNQDHLVRHFKKAAGRTNEKSERAVVLGRRLI